ncbi:hypothetical protein [Rhodopseudomonas palustris]|uniref:hypothetical protein n=1 Tax=Rhodopseudomonas palustris TaxID=1076 RepID=UPI000E5BAEA3|nr:hypothetical protein [Rhodopseudomonas palustris]QLH73214.1 hypothetical protein HZF03_21365 [Rhodopseudomonas palustris]RIA00352.1 hypothetical protein D1920_14435 [Rhodopseudomonas palustris]
MLFAGDASLLSEMISYERGALEFIRTKLFDQTEESHAKLVIDLSKEKTVDGLRPVTVAAFGYASISAEAVRSALSQFRPLAFASTFKMHDLIVEWILRANGSKAWAFKEKVIDYEKIAGRGALSEPFALSAWTTGSKAFWALYKVLMPFRNKVIHSGAFSVDDDALSIVSKERALTLSHAEQGAYVRAICLLADAILDNCCLSRQNLLIVENDLHDLRDIHQVPGVSFRSLRFASVEVIAPASYDPCRGLSACLDFDEIRERAEFVFPTDGVVIFDLTLRAHAEGRDVRWSFPFFSVPSGHKQIWEADPEYAPYLST